MVVHDSGLTEQQVRTNYLRVMERVQKAAVACGRDPQEISVVGVTKYVTAEVARWLVAAGCHQLAESRPQSLWDKAETLSDLAIDWHLIGHLQRNKAKRTLPLLKTLHSLDSTRLLQEVVEQSKSRAAPLSTLLEINVSKDMSKTGMAVDEAESILANWQARANPGLAIVGLMGMGSLEGSLTETAKEFQTLRDLRDRWNRDYGLNLRELSMGMSGDFEIGIQCGATMVRIGSILFDT